MKTPFVPITIPSIYSSNGQRVSLPKRMAQCAPDMANVLRGVGAALDAKGGLLVLSDLFRSYDMQLQSHLDYVNKKKSAFSPPPGGSLHEAGRALDLDLSSLKMSLADFWALATPIGLTPIITHPVAALSESWHFDCRGSHDLVYQYYAAGHANNMKPYAAMAASAILAIGVRVDAFGEHQDIAAVQAALIRLGQDPGHIDGVLGERSMKALRTVGVDASDPSAALVTLEASLATRFPAEFGSAQMPLDVTVPAHVIA